ncbi:hypothetical protein FOS14_23475 [Skermania sp. ID1734]|uniref:hypothetical protein n=1 Tax=Skermania sp. ID1734 TaxID=2597516 RepID=UPI00117D455D|nr:hypothetical protein [Skermania sp. ID1734]TSD93262.1 hypothetical protein FOS14_23475 [Skermania sp. ID1734]
MGKNFSSITPDNPAGTSAGDRPTRSSASSTNGATAAQGPRSSGRRQWLVWGLAGLVVVAMIGLAVGLATRSGGDDTSASSSVPHAPHGPSRIVDGVPLGYTRDASGAATAAVNFIQAYDLAWGGKLPLAAVQNHMVAAHPGAGLVSALNDAKDRKDTGEAFADLPAMTTVLSSTLDTADISIWAVTAGKSTIDKSANGATIATWGTSTLHLVWEDGDWKVADQSFHVGPQPGQPGAADTPGAQVQSGYYSFFVN